MEDHRGNISGGLVVRNLNEPWWRWYAISLWHTWQRRWLSVTRDAFSSVDCCFFGFFFFRSLSTEAAASTLQPAWLDDGQIVKQPAFIDTSTEITMLLALPYVVMDVRGCTAMWLSLHLITLSLSLSLSLSLFHSHTHTHTHTHTLDHIKIFF